MKNVDLVDFSECSFIEEMMKYYTFYDFCDNRKYLRMQYNRLSKNGKIFYRYYVYANIHMNETYKNYIMDYLNYYMDDLTLLDKKKFYKAR